VLTGVRADVAEGLVETADRVMAHRGPKHVIRRPAVVEAVRPDANHAARGEFFHFVTGHLLPLAGMGSGQGLMTDSTLNKR